MRWHGKKEPTGSPALEGAVVPSGKGGDALAA